MNLIDKNFEVLTNTIKSKALEEIFNDIRTSYLKLPKDIKDALENYFTRFNYWGKLKESLGIYEELYLRSVSLKEHIDDYIFLYQHLQDYRSKQLLFAIMNNWYKYDFSTLEQAIERNYPHYFDLDLVKCDKQEVIVDLGAFTGDTILDYFNVYGADCYKKIFCYEMTQSSVEILKNNLKYYPNVVTVPKAVSNIKGNLYLASNMDASANTLVEEGDIKIECTTIDEDINEKVTMIKMDIEGAEEKALLGCKNHIITDHPKLLISVYHNHEDIFKIPKMIEEICPGYKFYLRYYGNNLFPTEVVLIAIYE